MELLLSKWRPVKFLESGGTKNLYYIAWPTGTAKVGSKKTSCHCGKEPSNLHTSEKECQWFCWSKSLVKSTRKRHLHVHFVAQCFALALQSLFTSGTTAFLRQNGADDIKKHRWFKTIDWEAVPQRKLKVRAATR